MSIFSFNKKKITEKYVRLYIKHVNPEVVLTFIDNKLSFYELKKDFENILFVVIQNGLRSYGSDIDTQKKIDNLKKRKLLVDYFFTFNESYKEVYSQFIRNSDQFINKTHIFVLKCPFY